jgi:hypothetical protein
MLAYLDVLDAAWPPDKAAPITFVVIPEYVSRSWWERILYNQSARRLRSALLGRPHTVVVDVPYRREETALFEAVFGGDRGAERPDAGEAQSSPDAPGRSGLAVPPDRPPQPEPPSPAEPAAPPEGSSPPEPPVPPN